MTDNEYKWIEAHLGDRPDALRLAAHGRNDGFDYSNAILQIECRRKFGAKLASTLSAFPRFVFPSVLAGEQSTSDLLAAYHASLVPSGAVVADLTAGLGIDVFHMASRASRVTAVELDSNRAEALTYNAQGLQFDNVTVIEGDCMSFVDNCIASERRFDTIFIDPARRAADGSRVFALADCEPDVLAMMPKLEKICRQLIIKASPMLDVTHTVTSLPCVPVSVTAIGTTSECKELLINILFDSQPSEATIDAVTLKADGSISFAFTRSREEAAPKPIPSAAPVPGDYIYEPYPAVMKTGVFKLLADSFGLSIFHANTKLFYSKSHIADFPGHIYPIVEILPYASKIIKRFKSRYPKIEVAVRNFGISADALRHKLGVADGGDLRLYGYTDHRNEPMLAVVRRADV